MNRGECSSIGITSLEALPLQDMSTDAIDPVELMRAACRGTLLLRDLRRDPAARARIDGFIAANGIPTEERTWIQLDLDWADAKASGYDAESFYRQNVDTSRAKISVRNAHKGEPILSYMDYTAKEVLRHVINHPGYIKLPNPTNAPGSRFIGMFAADSDIDAIGQIAIGDVDGGRRTIDNSIYLINKLDGLLPNFNGYDSLNRSQSPTLSYAIERLAAAYGSDGEKVIAHYREPLAKLARWWMQKRRFQLPGPDGDLVFHFDCDIPADSDVFDGIRPESAAEDEELILRITAGLTGEARRLRALRLKRDIGAACESTEDFAHDSQAADYETLEANRTTDIAPVYLQANMVHLLRMAGYDAEADQLSSVIMRRFFHRIDDTHAQFVDLLRDGTSTKALHAAQFYPLLVGGIVPYEDALLLANTCRDAFLRPHGVLISIGQADAQWVGNPSETGDGEKDEFVRSMQTRMYGRSRLHEGGENRSWPSVGMWVSEAFTMAAIEARLHNKDPALLLEVAELARRATISGIEMRYEADHYIAEKLNALYPSLFVDGGEYAQQPEDAQKGFGMTIGSYRNLHNRSLFAEVHQPEAHSWRQWTLRRKLGKFALAA